MIFIIHFSAIFLNKGIKLVIYIIITIVVGYNKMMEYQSLNAYPFLLKGSNRAPHNQNLTKKDSILSYYHNIFREYRDKFKSSEINAAAFEEHNVTLATEQDCLEMNQQSDSIFSIVRTYNHGLQITYDVVMGPFKLRIIVVNLHCSSLTKSQSTSSSSLKTNEQYTASQEFINEGAVVVKQIPLPVLFDQVGDKVKRDGFQKCLRQYCIYKIGGLMGVGPALVKGKYDAICFRNCIQFRMQHCQKLSKTLVAGTIQQNLLVRLQSDYIDNMAIMHSIGLFHKDVKTKELVYSPKAGKFVFNSLQKAYFDKENMESATQFMKSQQKQMLYIDFLISRNLFINHYVPLVSIIDGSQTKTKRVNQIRDYLKKDGDLEDVFSSNNKQSLIDNHSIKQQMEYVPFVPLFSRPSVATSPNKEYNYNSLIFHEGLSNIVHTLCRKMQENYPITTYLRNKIIINESKKGKYAMKHLLKQFSKEFVHYFNQQSRSHILCIVKQWKNNIRHNCRSDESTINMLQTIIGKVDQPEVSRLRLLKQQLQLNNQEIDDQQVEIIVLRQLYYPLNHVYALNQLIISQRQEQPNLSLMKRRQVLFAREYLFCSNHAREMLFSYLMLMNLMASHFNQRQFFSLYVNWNKAVALFNFCFRFLIECRAAQQSDFVLYLQFNLSYMHMFQDVSLIEQCGNILQQYVCYLKDIDLSLAVKNQLASLYLKILPKYPIFFNDAFAVMMQLIMQYPEWGKQQLQAKFNLAMCSYYINQFNVSIDYFEKIYQQLQHFQIDLQTTIHFSAKLLYYTCKSLYSTARLQCSLQYLNLSLQHLRLLQETYQQDYLQYYIWTIHLKSAILIDLRRFQDSIDTVYQAVHVLQKVSKDRFKIQKINMLRLLTEAFLKKRIADQHERATFTYIVQVLVANLQNLSIANQQSNEPIMPINQIDVKREDAIFAYKQILKQISPLSRRPYFIHQYQQINYRLSKYYLREIHHLNEGLKYLWRYIESRTERSVSENDYQVMNMFVEYLMYSNSFRRAIIFMKKYIFRIPQMYIETRKKAFCLMGKAQSEIGDKMAKVYSQLIKDDCKVLIGKNFSGLFRKNNRQGHRKRMLEKWLLKF